MLDEPKIRELKTNISAQIEHFNIEISKKQKEIDDDKKRIHILQAKLSEINKVLQDESC